jgi:hypothetical protein
MRLGPLTEMSPEQAESARITARLVYTERVAEDRPRLGTHQGEGDGQIAGRVPDAEPAEVDHRAQVSVDGQQAPGVEVAVEPDRGPPPSRGGQRRISLAGVGEFQPWYGKTPRLCSLPAARPVLDRRFRR